MIAQLQKRLQELRQEYANGQARLVTLNSETLEVQETMIRISGAIQVLEEELSKSGTDTPVTEESLKAKA